MTPAVDALLTCKLKIRVDVYERYEEQAKISHRTLDEILSERLNACAGHKAQKPIFFNDRDRQQLEEAVGRNLSTPTEVLVAVRNAMRLKFGPVEVVLGETLTERLRSRCFDGLDFKRWLQRLVLDNLEVYANMR